MRTSRLAQCRLAYCQYSRLQRPIALSACPTCSGPPTRAPLRAPATEATPTRPTRTSTRCISNSFRSLRTCHCCACPPSPISDAFESLVSRPGSQSATPPAEGAPVRRASVCAVACTYAVQPRRGKHCEQNQLPVGSQSNAYRRLSLRYCVLITVADQVLDYFGWRLERFAAYGAMVWSQCVLVRRVHTRVMGTNVLAEHNSLVKCPRAHGASVGFLS